MSFDKGHGVCTKCGWFYLLLGEAERQARKGVRCRCAHCPCRGVCRIGCACEPIADGQRASAEWERRR